MNILGKRSDLPFSRKSDLKKEKSTACAEYYLQPNTVERHCAWVDIICKQLFAGHVMGSQPMKRKKNLLRVIMWWNCCYFLLNRKRWPWRTRWSNWSKGWEFVIESSFSWVVCNGLQHFVRTCTFCAIPSELALQHRYHEANTQFLEQRRCWGNNWFKTPKSIEQNSVLITKNLSSMVIFLISRRYVQVKLFTMQVLKHSKG